MLPAWAQTTAFTYQGRLTTGGNPANGSYDFQFKLFDALSDGAQIGVMPHPDGQPRPPVSNLNYLAGQVVPNALTRFERRSL